MKADENPPIDTEPGPGFQRGEIARIRPRTVGELVRDAEPLSEEAAREQIRRFYAENPSVKVYLDRRRSER